MRICQVSDTYFPYPGGISEHIYHLARELRRRGHTVRILTSNFGGESSSSLGTELEDQKFVRRIGRSVMVPSNRSYARVTIGRRTGREVEEFFAEEPFDIVHIHGSLAPTLPLAVLKRSTSINVVTFHADHRTSPGYRVFRRYLLKYFRRYHGLIAVSPAARDSHAKYFPGNYRIIPNGIDTDFFRPDVKPLPQFSDARPKILFMGRFDPRKGLRYLLKAFPLVKQEIPDAMCIVVGAGPFGYSRFSRYVDKSVADAVVFAGLIPGSARPHYYASCDVFCAPSTGNESFGIVLLEAMASGKPIVASDIAGYRDVLADGAEGLLAPPEDEEAIADRIVRILKDSDRARAMGRAGRAKALTYSWPRVTARVEAYYRELLQRHQKIVAE